MRVSRLIIVRPTFVAIMMLLSTSNANASNLVAEFESPDAEFNRILSGATAGENWISDRGNGLRRLVMDQQGVWNIDDYLYAIPHFDINGPDGRDYLYIVGGLVDGSSGITVFDCNQRLVIQEISLGTGYPLAGMTISNDHDYLYCLGYDWPRIGESYSFIDSGAHRDAGIVWRIDLN